MELKDSSKLASPYILPVGDIKKRLEEATTDVGRMYASIEDIWENVTEKYRFSRTMKHGEVLFDEIKGTISIIKESVSGNGFLAIMEPQLKMNRSSTINLKISENNSDIGVGVCLRDIVSSKGYECKCKNRLK